MMTMGGSGWRIWGVNTVSVMKKKLPRETITLFMLFPQNLWLISEQNALVSQSTSHVIKMF